jgi:hypothetical protein
MRWTCHVVVVVLSLFFLPRGGLLAEPGPASECFLAEGELSTSDRKLFLDTPEDPAPEKLLGVSEEYEGSHFVAGNEWNLSAFEPHIRGLGGAYIGVGADQAYFLIGWMRPELAWLTDYDKQVVRVHKVHQLFFREAKSAAGYLHFWSKEGREEALKLIAREVSDPVLRKRLVHRYKNSSGRIYRRLQRVKKEMRIPNYLTDAEQYKFIRERCLQGRVRPLRANLLDTKGVKGVADAARALGIPIRAIYLSNAEQYWNYGKEFRKNLRSLPADDRSVVLRTRGSWSANKDYRYVVQALLNFQEVLGSKRIRNLNRHLVFRKLRGPDDVDLILLDIKVGDKEKK